MGVWFSALPWTECAEAGGVHRRATGHAVSSVLLYSPTMAARVTALVADWIDAGGEHPRRGRGRGRRKRELLSDGICCCASSVQLRARWIAFLSSQGIHRDGFYIYR